MSPGSRAVFLSYASQDAEPALRIAQALRQARVEVWFDQSELRGGDAWDHRIRQQINDCELFVAVISRNTQSRQEGYFRLEWHLADQRTHRMGRSRPFILPVCIDDTREAGADVPDSFSSAQWTRLPDGAAAEKIAAHVAQLLSRPQSVSSSDTGRDTGTGAMALGAPERNSPRRLARWLIGAVAVIGAAGAVALWHARQTGPTPPMSAADRSIAVLPFADISEKKDQEYFADGMAEEILNLLAHVPQLRVVGRTSSFQFKGKTDDLRHIGTALGVAYLVEGSVRRSGDRVRVGAELIDVRDGAPRWSDTYDRDLTDVLKVQGDIAQSVARALQVSIASSSYLSGQPSLRSNEAYDTYLRGYLAHDRYDQRGLEEAVADMHHALELDPAFTRAAELLAVSLRDQVAWGFAPPIKGYEAARAATNTALRLDPSSALAHMMLGVISMEYDWDWPTADRALTLARSLAPNDPNVLIYSALERVYAGRPEEALQFANESLAADPLDGGNIGVRANIYTDLGRYDEAEADIRRALELAPHLNGAAAALGEVQLLEGRPDAALTSIQQESSPFARTEALALAYHSLRRPTEADAATRQLEKEHASDMAFEVSEIYAWRGQIDTAFRWLERAYEQKDSSLCTIKADPLLKSLRSDRRYAELLRRLHLPD